MTTSTRIPTPGDLAARTPRPLTARPANTAAPQRRQQAEAELWRDRWDNAVRYSGLHPHARLVALTAATYADPATGEIPQGGVLGTATLARASGLYEGTVQRALRELVHGGFVTRTRAADGGPNRIELHVPTAARAR